MAMLARLLHLKFSATRPPHIEPLIPLRQIKMRQAGERRARLVDWIPSCFFSRDQNAVDHSQALLEGEDASLKPVPHTNV
jgi:hypothetical protein